MFRACCVESVSNDHANGLFMANSGSHGRFKVCFPLNAKRSNRRLSLLELQPVVFDLAAEFGQKIVVNTALHQSGTEAAMGRFVRYGSVQIKPAEDHEVQTNLQCAFQLGLAHTVPLTCQQALEQDKRIISLRADPGSPRTALEYRRKQPPIHQRINPGQGIICPNPRRFSIIDHRLRKVPELKQPPKAAPQNAMGFSESQGKFTRPAPHPRLVSSRDEQEKRRAQDAPISQFKRFWIISLLRGWFRRDADLSALPRRGRPIPATVTRSDAGHRRYGIGPRDPLRSRHAHHRCIQ